jgi:hypothetical protein
MNKPSIIIVLLILALLEASFIYSSYEPKINKPTDATVGIIQKTK